MYKVIKDIDLTALNIKYKLDKNRAKITETVESRVIVLAKNVLLNVMRVIPNYL